MNTFTENERQAFNILATESMKGGLFDVTELAEACGWSIPKTKGVVGSLTKKGKVEAESGDRFKPPVLWAIHPEEGPCFWGDAISKEDFAKALL